MYILLSKVSFPHSLSSEEFETFLQGNSKWGVHVDLNEYAQLFDSTYGTELFSGVKRPGSYSREDWWKTRAYMWFNTTIPVSSQVLKKINNHLRRYYKLPIGEYSDFMQIKDIKESIKDFDRVFK